MSTAGLFHSRLVNDKFQCFCGTTVNTNFVSTDAVAFSSAHFGAGVGLIYLDNVDCSGSESRLTDCLHSSSASCRFDHNEDAGVRCQGKFV